MECEKPDWVAQVEGILGVLNEGVLIANDCRQIIYVNDRLAEMVGSPASEIIGLSAAEFYSPGEYAYLMAHSAENTLDGQSRFEFVLPQRDGGRAPVIISSRSVEDFDGHRFGIVMFTDIAEQKRAQRQLQEANAQLEKRHKEIEDDLALAARVQQSLAPQSIVWGGMRVETFLHPVRTIGGDFGLVTAQDDEHLTLLVCDVSGHGIGSALVANRLYAEILAEMRSGAGLSEMLGELNRFVLRSIGGSSFLFTAAAARLDRGGRRMIFAGAGHPPGMIVTPGREPRLLESRSMLLGALEDAIEPDAELCVDLDPGDRVVLYTDGLTEVFDSQREMLDVDGLRKIVGETSHLPLGEMKQGILDRVAAWRSGPPSDDTSLVLLEVL
ncbi:MAG TPA: SpoIIE family protein phosphatase [Candidatus Acidoferrales bacterium]|nr:SpoIIE family protein phosphatase [Candidatus Acidoferrales bacterium]